MKHYVRKRKCLPNSFEEDAADERMGVTKTYGSNLYMDVANTTYARTLLNNIVLGDGEGYRVANKIIMTELQLNTCVQAWHGTGTAGIFRAMVVYDGQASCTDIDLNALFGFPSFYGFRQPCGKQRFKILLDETLKYPGNITGDCAGYQQIPFIRTLQFSLPTIYNELNTGYIDDINSGALYFMVMGSQYKDMSYRHAYLEGLFELKFDDR